jgi:hypothetical protein
MRTVQWLFAVAVLLFVSGIGFIIAGERRLQQGGAAPVAQPSGPPVATVKQIMNAIVMPHATVVYDAVGSVSTAAGIVETFPRTDKAWDGVADSAAALVEAGNLLLMSGRALDNDGWTAATREFMTQAQLVLTAAQAHKADDVFMAGGDLNVTCDKCHERYQRR